MIHKIPKEDNPFDEQPELAMAWELGWYRRNQDFIEHIAEVSRWAIEFRHKIRGVLFPYYPNNPLSLDDELIDAIERLVIKEVARKKR